MFCGGDDFRVFLCHHLGLELLMLGFNESFFIFWLYLNKYKLSMMYEVKGKIVKFYLCVFLTSSLCVFILLIFFIFWILGPPITILETSTYHFFFQNQHLNYVSIYLLLPKGQFGLLGITLFFEDNTKIHWKSTVRN